MTLKKILNFTLISINEYELKISHLIIVLLIILLSSLFLRLIKKVIVKQLVKKGKADAGRSAAFYQVIRYITFIISVSIFLETVGFDISILLAGSAALLLGLGFGVQQIFNDLVSGIILLFEGTISVGDIVEIDSLVGKVLEIKLRTSIIEVRNGNNIIIPNSKLVSNNVINWSYNREATIFRVKVGVAYGTDTKKVKQLLEDIVASHQEVLNTFKPIARLVNFGDSSLDFEVLFCTYEMMQIEFIKSEIRFKIDESFRKNNITIPFPQRDVHMKPV